MFVGKGPVKKLLSKRLQMQKYISRQKKNKNLSY